MNISTNFNKDGCDYEVYDSYGYAYAYCKNGSKFFFPNFTSFGNGTALASYEYFTNGSYVIHYKNGTDRFFD